MDNRYYNYAENLNNDDISVRLDSLQNLMRGVVKGYISKPDSGVDVNNHIHTIYSFSPYSPTKAIWMAYNAGLTTAGIMDHDSISGAHEFIQAGKIVGMATTIGVECRVDFSNTPLNNRRINNPDQKSVAYVALHGIPHNHINTVKDYFLPYQEKRNIRNARMVDNLNDLFIPFNIKIDFEKDVIPLSKSDDGGSITERHILFALAGKIIENYGLGIKTVSFIENDLKLNISPKIREYLLDSNNDFYKYDLLGVLKSDLVEHFYIDAGPECPDVRDMVDLARGTGAISAYAYLGDVGQSVTGDKKAQKFEDDYLDLLFEVIKGLGFNAVTYMPTRNTLIQLKRVKMLCDRYEFLQISGEDINSPRQSFICPILREKEFNNLIDSTWALIGHEKVATQNIDNGLFSHFTVSKYPDLNQRIQIYREFGKADYNIK